MFGELLRRVWLGPQKSLRFLVIGRLFWGQPVNTCTRLLEQDKNSHTQSMVARRGLTNLANVYTPMWKSLKHSTAANGHRFIAKKRKLKCRRTALRRHARRPETGDFLGALYSVLWIKISVNNKPVKVSACYVVTLLSCYVVTLLRCYVVTLLSCYVVTLLRCYVVTLCHSLENNENAFVLVVFRWNLGKSTFPKFHFSHNLQHLGQNYFTRFTVNNVYILIWTSLLFFELPILHFAWLLEYQGNFPQGKSVCICMHSLYILYFST